MGEQSKIEWTTHTFNAWIGCTPISAACDECYAEDLAGRYGWAKWGPGEPRKRTSPANWKKPLKWNRDAVASGTRPRVFSDSLADWADAEVDEAWRRDHFDLIRATPQLDWLLLTKRHALAPGFLEKYAQGLTNIRVGMTVENQPMAGIRLPRLRQIREMGFPTFVSYEPALGRVDWEPWINAIDWLIAGGESGPKARPPHPAWFRAARDVCAKHGVPFFFKQWGEWHTGFTHMSTGQAVFKQFATFDQWVGKASTWVNGGACLDINGLQMRNGADMQKAWDEDRFPIIILHRVGKKNAGALLDGVEHKAFPS